MTPPGLAAIPASGLGVAVAPFLTLPDAQLIAHAPTDLAALCDEVEAQAAECERLRAEVADLRYQLAAERDRCPECGRRRAGARPVGDRCPSCVAGEMLTKGDDER